MDHVVPVEEGVKRLDIHCRLSAICGEKEPERSSVFSWVRSCTSGNQTAQKIAKLRSYGDIACTRDNANHIRFEHDR